MFPGRFVVAVALLSIIGCAPDEIAPVSTGPLDDLAKIPQDATAFAETGRVVAQFRSGHGPIPVLFECYRIRTDSGMPRLDIRFSTSHLMMASTR